MSKDKRKHKREQVGDICDAKSHLFLKFFYFRVLIVHVQRQGTIQRRTQKVGMFAKPTVTCFLLRGFVVLFHKGI